MAITEQRMEIHEIMKNVIIKILFCFAESKTSKGQKRTHSPVIECTPNGVGQHVTVSSPALVELLTHVDAGQDNGRGASDEHASGENEPNNSSQFSVTEYDAHDACCLLKCEIHRNFKYNTTIEK
jgi:hypothetical protein